MRSGCVAGSPPSTSGIVEIVRTFSVTSSPVRPSPRVAARDQPALLVQQRDGQPVDLQLAQVVDATRPTRGPGAARPAQVAMSSSENALSSDSIRSTCCDRRELRRERAAHPLRRRVRRAQPRVLVLQRLQLAQPLVVLLVRRHRARRGCSTRTGPPRSGRPARPTGDGRARGSRSRRTRSRARVLRRSPAHPLAHRPHLRCPRRQVARRPPSAQPRPDHQHPAHQHAADREHRTVANSGTDAAATTTSVGSPSTSHVQMAFGGTTV